MDAIYTQPCIHIYISLGTLEEYMRNSKNDSFQSFANHDEEDNYSL